MYRIRWCEIERSSAGSIKEETGRITVIAGDVNNIP